MRLMLTCALLLTSVALYVTKGTTRFSEGLQRYEQNFSRETSSSDSGSEDGVFAQGFAGMPPGGPAIGRRSNITTYNIMDGTVHRLHDEEKDIENLYIERNWSDKSFWMTEEESVAAYEVKPFIFDDADTEAPDSDMEDDIISIMSSEDDYYYNDIYLNNTIELKLDGMTVKPKLSLGKSLKVSSSMLWLDPALIAGPDAKQSREFAKLWKGYEQKSGLSGRDKLNKTRASFFKPTKATKIVK